MLTPHNIISIFEEHGVPSYGINLEFLPNHDLIRQLTVRFKIEFAVMFTIIENNFFLFSGTLNYIELPIDKNELLLKHSHPLGTPYPSIYDITWLRMAQSVGSPQIQSLILPIGKDKVAFNINTPTFNYYGKA